MRAGRDRSWVIDACVGTKDFAADWAWSPPSRRVPSNRATATAQTLGRLTLPVHVEDGVVDQLAGLGVEVTPFVSMKIGDGVLPRFSNRAQRRWLIRAVKVVPA